MKIQINGYYPNTDITSNTDTSVNSADTSFEEVLVLNQTALKAMAIDAMVAESSTGSVNPDAVNAAAIMKFRNTLAEHVVAPIPEEDVSKTTSTGSIFGDLMQQSATSTEGVYNSGILTCSEELNTYFKEAADTYGVDVKLLKAIAYAESNFKSDCTSKSGAAGIMQLMPATAVEYGVSDVYDARQNILGGAKVISQMLNSYDGDISLALAAYNAGSGNVAKYGGIPPFEETQKYVPKVLSYYNS